MEESPNERIRLFLEHKRIKVAEAVRRTGIGQSTLYNVLNGTAKSAPSYETLQMMLAGFPDLNPDWLLLGSAPMLRDGRSLTPLEAPATKAAPVTQAPVATAPASGADPELLKEIRDSRELAWRLAEKEQRNAEYWRALYMAEVRRYMHVDEPHEDSPESPAATALPGKAEVDSFAAETSEEAGRAWIGLGHRDPHTGGMVKMSTDNVQLLENAEAVVRLIKPFTNPYLDLVIDETPEGEEEDYRIAL